MNNKQNMFRDILTVIAVALIFTAIFFYIIPIGIERNENMECMKLQQQEQENPTTFYWTDWQVEMCEGK